MAEVQHWDLGGRGGIPSPGRDTLPTRCNAEPHGSPCAHACGALAGMQLQPILPVPPAGTRHRTVMHPRIAQAAVVWVHATYSTDTCFVWSMRFVTFWEQHCACNTLISGAMVQRSVDLGCSGHSWHTINTYPVFQANWGLQMRLFVIFTLCGHSLLPPYYAVLHSDLWETPAMGVFTSVLYGFIAHSSFPAHLAVTLRCTSCHGTCRHPPSLQCSRLTRLQPFAFSLSQP